MDLRSIWGTWLKFRFWVVHPTKVRFGRSGLPPRSALRERFQHFRVRDRGPPRASGSVSWLAGSCWGGGPWSPGRGCTGPSTAAMRVMSGTGDVLDKHRQWLKKRPAECVTWTWGSFRDHGTLAEVACRPSLHRRKAPVERMGARCRHQQDRFEPCCNLLNS